MSAIPKPEKGARRGEVHGRWTILRDAGSSTDREPRAWAQCDCGTERLVRTRHVTRGRSRSCGCLRADKPKAPCKACGGTEFYGNRGGLCKACVCAQGKAKRLAAKLARPVITHKTCKHCGQTKERALFPYGVGRVCKACAWSYQKARGFCPAIRARRAKRLPPPPPDIDGLRQCLRCSKHKPLWRFRPTYSVKDPATGRMKTGDKRRRICTACVTKKQIQKDPARHRSFQQRRLDAKRAGYVDPDSWRAVVEFYGGLCCHCEAAPWEQQDHFVALARGGIHTISNVGPSCAPCNYRKNVRTWWPKRRHPFMAPLEEKTA